MVIIFHDKQILRFFVLEADNDDKNGVVWMGWLQVKAPDAQKRDNRFLAPKYRPHVVGQTSLIGIDDYRDSEACVCYINLFGQPREVT